MIRTATEFAAAVARGATSLELDLTEPVRLDGVRTPLTLTGRIAPATLASEFSPLLLINDCAQLTLDGLTLVGQAKPERGFNGRGMTISNSREVALRRCNFGSLMQGIVAVACTDMIVDSSDFHDIQTDGIIGQQFVRFQALANWFRSFFPLGPDHSDCIQFHSNNKATDDCDGALIKGNLVDLTPADMTQGFWLSDPHFGGHRNVSVEANLLIGTIWNGIGVGGCKNPAVIGNRLLKPIGSAYDPRIRTDGVPAILEANEAPAYALAAWDSAIPAGNIVNAAVDQAAIDAARSAWMAVNRAGAVPAPAPEPAPAPNAALLERVQKARKEANDVKNGAARSVYALDQLIAEMSELRPVQSV